MSINDGSFLPYSFLVNYEVSKAIFDSKVITIQLDPNNSFQETRQKIINKIRQEIPDYREKSIEVNFTKLGSDTDNNAQFKSLFPDNSAKIVLEITISLPKSITIHYRDKPCEIPVEGIDEFISIHTKCRKQFNIENNKDFFIMQCEKGQNSKVDMGTNVQSYIDKHPNYYFFIEFSVAPPLIEFTFCFINDAGNSIQSFKENFSPKYKIGDFHKFIRQKYNFDDGDFILAVKNKYTNKTENVGKKWKFECSKYFPEIKIVLNVSIDFSITVNIGNQINSFEKTFKSNTKISDVQKEIILKYDLKLKAEQINLDHPKMKGKKYLSELNDQRELRFSIENYYAYYKRYKSKNRKKKSIDLFQYRTIGDLKKYLSEYYNQKGYHISQEYIRIDGSGYTDMDNEMKLEATHNYTAYVPHDIYYINNDYERKSLIEECPDAYKKCPLDNGGDYFVSYLTKVLEQGNYLVYQGEKKLKDKDIIQFDKPVIAIQEGKPLKFIITHEQSQTILLNQDSLITEISHSIRSEVDNPKYHIELEDGSKTTLTNERALDVFIKHGNKIIVTETINSIRFITKSDKKSYYFVFRSMSLVQYIKKVLSKRFTYGNDPNLSQISLTRSGKELDDRVMFHEIVQSPINDPIIIQAKDPNKEAEFRVTYQCSFKKPNEPDLIYPLRFKSDPLIGDVLKFMAQKLGYSSLRLIWKDEPLDEQPNKYFSDFRIQPEETLTIIPPIDQVPVQYVFNIITLKTRYEKSESFKNNETFRNVRTRFESDLKSVEFVFIKDGIIINEDEKVGKFNTNIFDIVELHKYVVNIYPISWKDVTDPLPITTTVKELKSLLKHFNNIEPNKYLDIHHRNIPVADDEQLMSMESFSAKPRPLNLHFQLNGSVDLLKQTLFFNDTLENAVNIITQKYFISSDQVQLLFNRNQLDAKKSILQNKIVNEDKIIIKLKEISYIFKINGNNLNHNFLPNQTISEVLEIFLNENTKENKGNFLIPHAKDFEMISELARKYSPNPIEVIWRDPNKKTKYTFIYNEENEEDDKKNRIERAFDLNADTTIQEVRSLIAKEIFEDDVSEDNITLMFAGKLLNDHQTLKSINIPEKGEIFINKIDDDELYLTTVMNLTNFYIGETETYTDDVSIQKNSDENDLEEGLTG